MKLEELREVAAKAVNERRIIDGPRNNLMQIRPLKHPFARDMVETAISNNWTQHETNLSADAKQYATSQLSKGDITVFKSALAFLSNLDGIQLNNLTNNIGRYITSPECSIFIARQAWDEALHVLTYTKIIETIGLDPIEIYWMYRTDEKLAEKNEYITKSSMLLGEGYTPENFVMAVVANIVLEGVYFYSGFASFYMLARQGKLRGVAKDIKLIQRDEVNHLNFFVHLWHTLRQERPELFTPELIRKVVDFIKLAVDYEASWGAWIIRDGLMGATETTQRQFVEHIADRRAVSMGLPPIFDTKNPYPWFDTYSKVNTEENFFESDVANYTTEDLEW